MKDAQTKIGSLREGRKRRKQNGSYTLFGKVDFEPNELIEKEVSKKMTTSPICEHKSFYKKNSFCLFLFFYLTKRVQRKLNFPISFFSYFS